MPSLISHASPELTCVPGIDQKTAFRSVAPATIATAKVSPQEFLVAVLPPRKVDIENLHWLLYSAIMTGMGDTKPRVRRFHFTPDSIVIALLVVECSLFYRGVFTYYPKDGRCWSP